MYTQNHYTVNNSKYARFEWVIVFYGRLITHTKDNIGCLSVMSRASAVLDSPQTTIGAQDLLNVGRCTKSGFLRKQGTLERLFKFLKWRQRFVILSRGCIYIFKDELANRPQFSYSLRAFLQSARHTEGRARWSFRVVPTDQRGKILMFACINDEERKDWMKSIKEEMVKAHKISEALLNARGEDRDDYVYLEKPIPEKPAKTLTEKIPSDEEEEEDDDPGGEKDYTTIDDAMLDALPPMPEPAVKPKNDKKKPLKPNLKPGPPNHTMPTGRSTNKAGQNKTPIKASTLPAIPVSCSPGEVSRTAFEYHGSGDRHEIESLLVERPEGTYLVRQSRQDGKEVLSVNIEGALKEFKIYEKNSKMTVNNIDYFDSVEGLIQNYIDKPLPKKSTKLYRAYSVTDPRYIN